MSPFTALLAVTIAYVLLLSSGECFSASVTSYDVRRRREATSSVSGAEDQGAQSDTIAIEKRGVKKSRRPVMYDSHYKAFFSRLDANKDGQIDYSEGLLYFYAVDKNHDGILENREFKITKSY